VCEAGEGFRGFVPQRPNSVNDLLVVVIKAKQKTGHQKCEDYEDKLGSGSPWGAERSRGHHSLSERHKKGLEKLPCFSLPPINHGLISIICSNSIKAED